MLCLKASRRKGDQSILRSRSSKVSALARKPVAETSYGQRCGGTAMDVLQSSFTVADWIALGLIALVPVLMILGILAIRREMHPEALLRAQSIQLKTTKNQRQHWRKTALSRDMIDVLDDVDTLLNVIAADQAAARQQHKEAVRLSWASRHIPLRTLLLGGIALAGVLSTILMVVAEGPRNPIP